MKKIVYVIANNNGGFHTELKEGYLITSKAGRLYGVSGTNGNWWITDIITGCIVGKCEKLNKVNETVTPREKEIERLIESDDFTHIIAEVYKTYSFTKIRWFDEIILSR